MKYLLSGHNSRTSGFFDNSSKAFEVNSKETPRPQPPSMKNLGVNRPSVQPHLSASMLSQNEFYSQPNAPQRSAVDAMNARKHQASDYEGINSGKNFQSTSNNLRPERADSSKQTTARYQNFISPQDRPAPSRQGVPLNEKLEELSRAPSIHEMATGYYCPMPLFYKRVLFP